MGIEGKGIRLRRLARRITSLIVGPLSNKPLAATLGPALLLPPAATSKVYIGAAGWPTVYRGVRSDAQIYRGAKVLR